MRASRRPLWYLSAVRRLAALTITLALLSACGGSDDSDDAAVAQNVPEAGADADAGEGEAAEPGPDQSPIVEALEVSSADGAAVLTIPAGALPAGVGPDDVSITDITADAAALTEGVPLLAAYELRPSGLQFPEPVTLTVRLPFTPGQPHDFVLLGDAGEFEVLRATLAEVDGEAREAVWALALPHFSSVHIFTSIQDGVTLEPRPIPDVNVGEAFIAQVVVRRGNWEGESTVRGFFVGEDAPSGIVHLTILTTTGEWTLAGDFRAAGPVTPTEGTNPDPRMAFADRSEFLVEQAFTCTAVGAFTISYTADAELQISRRVVRTQGGEVISDELVTPPPGREAVQAVGVAALSGVCRDQIVAQAAAPITTYSVEVPGDAGTFTWSGTDCGSVTGSTTNTTVWNHGEEDCVHVGEAHPTTMIELVMVIDEIEWRCTYLSAASGTGPLCERPIRVGESSS